MICSKCGAESPKNSDYCNKCGNKIERVYDDTFAYVCPICKTPNHKSAKHCIKCGHWLLDSNFGAKPITEQQYGVVSPNPHNF